MVSQNMKDETRKAIAATIKHFESATNRRGDVELAVSETAVGLVCLTGIIDDLFEEVEALQNEVKALREGQ